MAFRFTHLFGDDDGEIWFAEVELPTSAPGVGVAENWTLPST